MKAIEDLKEVYPELNIEENEDGLLISGGVDAVDSADCRMDKYIPTEYKREMLSVFYEPNSAIRVYRRVA